MKQQPFEAPLVMVPTRVIEKIDEEARAHPPNETGQSMIGLELENVIIVLDVIPDMVNIRRAPGSLNMGGNFQVEVFNWYKTHWERLRLLSEECKADWAPGKPLPPNWLLPPALNLPLSVVGEWHKHPGNMTSLSGTDLHQINSILRDREQDRHQFMTPIITYDKSSWYSYEYEGPKLVTKISQRIYKTWYYSSRTSRGPQEIKPRVVANEMVPEMPPLPWYLINLSLMEKEVGLLRSNGYRVNWRIKDVDADGIDEILFGIDHPDWGKRAIVTTRWNYPETAPIIRTIPKANVEAIPVVQNLVTLNQPERPNGLFGWLKQVFWPAENEQPTYFRSTWDRNSYLLDRIRAIHGEMRYVGPNREEDRQPSDQVTS